MENMILPLVACILLVGIHAYLGIHVLARKVIFVDLALAQIAALGAVYGLFMGLSFDEHPILIKVVSIIFSLLGAILISLSKVKHKLIPHEAIIGVIYATALSLLILLSANLAHGADEIRQLLSGSILWVSQKEILYTLFLYLFIGLVHFIFRQNFFALSYGVSIPNKALWDFLFYATFGLVVTSSVGIGGVLLVFGYLIIPSLIGVLCAQTTKNRLFCAWFFGVLASVLGVVFSYEFDMPSGPSIVVILALILLFIFLLKTFYTSKTKFFIFLLFIFLFVSVVFLINYFISSNIKTNEHALIMDTPKILINDLTSDDSQKNLEALKLIDEKNSQYLMPYVAKLLLSKDYQVRFLSVETIGNQNYTNAIKDLLLLANTENDVFLQIEIAKTLCALKEAEGIYILAKIIKNSSEKIAQEDALNILKNIVLENFFKENNFIEQILNKKINFIFNEKLNKFSR